MSKISCILVDDEIMLLNSLKNSIIKYIPEIEILACCNSGEEALKACQKLSPKIVFLDIVMPKMDGFQFLSSVKEQNFEVIFVTGYDDYALKAIKFSALAYLLKPVDSDDLIKAVKQASERIELKESKIMYDILIKNSQESKEENFKFLVQDKNEKVIIKISDLMACESTNSCTKLHLINGKVITSSYNIGKFAKMLEPYFFKLIHKSYLVNTKHIKSYDKSNHVILDNGLKFPMSFRRKGEVIEMMKG